MKSLQILHLRRLTIWLSNVFLQILFYTSLPIAKYVSFSLFFAIESFTTNYKNLIISYNQPETLSVEAELLFGCDYIEDIVKYKKT